MSILRRSTWIAWIENFVVAFIITATFYILSPIHSDVSSLKSISIPKGATSQSIIAQLNTRGYNISVIDSFILGQMGKIKQGKVASKKQALNRIDFLYTMTKAKIALLRITLIPGETNEIFLGLVAKKVDINKTKLLNAYKTYAKYPEAGISADTYLVPKKMNEEKLIKFLLESSERKYKKLAEKAYGEYNTSQWHKILTIASIIQKEAANNQEMPLIASVIFNRLKKNMRLQMDGTLNYGKYSHIKVTPHRIKTDKSSFNTYKHKGLPSSPIGSVSVHAIQSAIHPATSKYLYFMRNKDGVHDFTDTFKKHRRNIRKVQ
ncbi:MAG: endolytic transglycosylase MltG [Sulfurovum sp.]|nr:endolytic transglycosylase MltG [Sulfurovum sp.]